MGGPIDLRRLGETCSRLESEPDIDDPPFADNDFGQWALPRHQGMGRRLTVTPGARDINCAADTSARTRGRSLVR